MGVPTAVFTETNLGTYLAVPASPDITADDFKREVEMAHLNCFPEFGTIRVKAVMVTQKLQRYHLSGSLPLKFAFLGSNVNWFLQAHVILSNVPTRVESRRHNGAEVCNLNSAANVITDSLEVAGASYEKRTKCKRKIKIGGFLKISTALCFRRKWKRKNVKKKPETRHPIRGRMQHCLVEKEMCEFATGAEVNLSNKSDSNVIGEATSETISVSGIINKYFSDYGEVASNPESLFTTARYRCRKQRTGCEYRSGVVKSHVSPSSERHKTPNIGKGLLVASASWGLTPCNRRSILSLYRQNHGESLFPEFSATEDSV
ncbi:uncharacterized protein LOC131007240 [Salvia miltiorrhiza]|uniref:uncharacterized protein LOC131007240 n=1 Tax=Salvia miltiorrhiza TaxID=226208 RepID=UPI0025ABE42F|nr:uncharacterized protein LOC131007240 [Salvia miltiorrhiza]